MLGFREHLSTRFIYAALLLALSFLVYIPSLAYQNIFLDDDALARNSDATISEIFSKDVFLGRDVKSGFYRPIMALSFSYDRHIADFVDGISGGSIGKMRRNSSSMPFCMMFISHLTNVLLHSLFCILLLNWFAIYGVRLGTAFLAAALFAVLPYNATAVAWLGGRNDIILAIFIVSAFLFLRKFEEGRNFKYMSAMSVCFLLALFSKETAMSFAVAAPIAIASYMKPDGNNNGLTQSLRQDMKKFACFFAAILIPIVIYLVCRNNADLAQNAFSHIRLYSVFNVPYLLAGYILSIPILNQIPHFLAYIVAYISLLALVFLPVIFWRRTGFNRPAAITGLCVFLFFIVPPLLSTDSPVGWFYMRHRLYLPLAGLLLYFLAIFGNGGLFHINPEFPSEKKNVLYAFFAVFLIFSIANTILDIGNFKNRLDFSIRTMEENPAKYGESLYSAGAWYFAHGQHDFAQTYYRHARERGEVSPELYLHLAYIELGNGNIEAAYRELREGYDKFPNDEYLGQNVENFEKNMK